MPMFKSVKVSYMMPDQPKGIYKHCGLIMTQNRADNGSVGQQIWVGHGSVPVTHWPILHCMHPAIFWLMATETVILTLCQYFFTISVTLWPETNRQLQKHTDFLEKTQLLLKF